MLWLGSAPSFGESDFGGGWGSVLSEVENDIGDRLAGSGDDPLVELRRGYHDRIAGVRGRSAVLLRSAIEGAEEATEYFSGGGTPAGRRMPRVDEMRAAAAEVDTEVMGLLALESPVARDLRLILAARDVTQIGLLCVGLVADLGRRIERVGDTLNPELRGRFGEVGNETDGLLRSAEAAWVSLDTDMALRVPEGARAGRTGQTVLMATLIGLTAVPMETAIDLAMVARVYERLTDHALEIAERVVFAVLGPA